MEDLAEAKMVEETMAAKVALMTQRLEELIQETADLRARTEGLAIAMEDLNGTISALSEKIGAKA